MERIIIKAHGFPDLFSQLAPMFRAQNVPAGFRRFMDRDDVALVQDAHDRAAAHLDELMQDTNQTEEALRDFGNY
jgi:hypothetical protein